MGRRIGRCLSAMMLLVFPATGCRREAAAPADGRTAVWLDISPAFGDPPRDPGDGLALLQAYGSGRLNVRGVSVTFGNVPLVRGFPTAQELMKRLDTGLLRPWRGPSSREEREAPTEATELLEEALRTEPLTIIAVGPATTVASMLLRQPDLAERIERVVLVAGLRPGVTTSIEAFNAEHDVTTALDAGSVQALLTSSVALTLVPGGASSLVDLDAADLDRLDQGHGPIKLITPSARLWLDAKTRPHAGAAFPVPAMVAVDVVAHPGTIRCEAAVAGVGPSGPNGPRLIVEEGLHGRRVTWCHTADPSAKARMIDDVLRVQPLRQ
jgi:inosine-uridine nucleoside N-ribohydrolase